jgi:rhodanese-related sulfurtransferase
MYANRLLDGGSIKRIDDAGMAKVIAESDIVTTYFVDVRSAEEYRAGHHPIARNVTAGQLVQELDRTLGVRHGRVVLLDDIGDRAAFAGYWIVQAGWRDVCWFSYENSRTSLTGDSWRTLSSAADRGVACNYIGVCELAYLIACEQALVIDVSSSVEFERARIPGALFAIRSQLPSGLDAVIPDGVKLVLTSEDGRRAGLASHELCKYGDRVRLLLGGNRAWHEAGMAMDSGPGTYLHPPHDVRRSIYGNPTDVYEAMRGYIQWEVELIDGARNEHYLTLPAFARYGT